MKGTRKKSSSGKLDKSSKSHALKPKDVVKVAADAANENPGAETFSRNNPLNPSVRPAKAKKGVVVKRGGDVTEEDRDLPPPPTPPWLDAPEADEEPIDYESRPFPTPVPFVSNEVEPGPFDDKKKKKIAGVKTSRTRISGIFCFVELRLVMSPPLISTK